MSKFSLTDIIALAKAGYKPSDVKELMQMDASLNEQPEAPAGVSEAPEEKDIKGPSENSGKDPEQEQEPPSKPADVIDYKSKYEEAASKLSKLQEQNTKKAAPITPKEQELNDFDDFLRSLM